MIRVQFERQFIKQVRDLPKAQKEKLERLIVLLQHNPFDTRLHSKKLNPPLDDHLSFRITRDWRVQFRFLDTKTIQLLEVKHRKDIYR